MRWKLAIGLVLLPWVAQATLYKAVANGNVNNNSTWSPSATPGAGDTVYIGTYTVTVPNGYAWTIGACQTSFPSGVYSIEVSTTGSFIVAGGSTLTLRGEARFDGTAGGGDFGQTFNVGTGGVIQLDECNGNIPSRFYPTTYGSITHMTFGTSGDAYKTTSTCAGACTHITSLNNGTTNGILWDISQAGKANAEMNFYGVVWDHCGGPLVPCVGFSMTTDGGSLSSFNAINNSITQSGVAFGEDTTYGWNCSACSYNIDVMSYTNPISTTTGGLFLYPDDPTGGAVRNITHYIGSIMGPSNLAYTYSALFGFTVKYDVFTDIMLPGGFITSLADMWTEDQSFFNQSNCRQDTRPLLAPGSVSNSYFLATDAQTDSAQNCSLLGAAVGGTAIAGSSYTWTKNVFDIQSAGATMPLRNNHIVPGGGGIPPYTWTFSYNIFVGNNTGHSPPQYPGGDMGNYTVSSTCTFQYTHNTSLAMLNPGVTGDTSMFRVGESFIISPSSSTSFFTDNLFSTDGTYTAYPIVEMGSGAPQPQPWNLIPPQNMHNNDDYGSYAVTQWVNGFGPCSVSEPCTSNGTNYDMPTSTFTPGTSDLKVAAQFVDTTRNAETWAYSVGQSSTSAGVIQAFLNNGPAASSTTLNSLLTWVRAGYTPTNYAIATAADDGTTMGAIQMQELPTIIQGSAKISGSAIVQ